VSTARCGVQMSIDVPDDFWGQLRPRPVGYFTFINWDSVRHCWRRRGYCRGHGRQRRRWLLWSARHLGTAYKETGGVTTRSVTNAQGHATPLSAKNCRKRQLFAHAQTTFFFKNGFCLNQNKSRNHLRYVSSICAPVVRVLLAEFYFPSSKTQKDSE
jgi:hypothetical protein